MPRQTVPGLLSWSYRFPSPRLWYCFIWCCPVSQAAETEALDILKEAEVERSALLKATKTVPPAEDKVEPAADVTKADATTPDVSEPKVSTSTPLNPPPSPEAANPP